MKKMIMLVGILAALLVVPTASSAASGSAGPTANSAVAHKAQTVNTCADATRVANLGLHRYKKVYKKWRNGRTSTRHMKWARRIWKAELRQKAQICSQTQPPRPPPPPAALPLSSSEVIAAVTQIAKNECDIDGNCSDYGAYSASSCDYITASQAACYGWNYEGFGDGSTCDFREILSRTGYNGLTATRDTSYGNTSDGRFYCYF